MKIEHFNIPEDYSKVGSLWHKGWHNSWRMNEVFISELSNRELEIDCFLTVLKSIDKSSINMIELGSAWGEWGLTLAGVTRTKLIPTSIRSYNYLAVEGEKYYSELAQEHIDYNRMWGTVYNCAVSNYDGYCYFDKFKGHRNFFDTWCTQGITFNGNVAGSRLKTWILAFYRLLLGELTRVRVCTLDSIVKSWGYYPDLIHMDIEGIEVKVVSSTTIKPLYWLIGTHSSSINRHLEYILSKEYDCMVNVLPSSKKVKGLGQDGLQLWRKK